MTPGTQRNHFVAGFFTAAAGFFRNPFKGRFGLFRLLRGGRLLGRIKTLRILGGGVAVIILLQILFDDEQRIVRLLDGFLPVALMDGHRTDDDQQRSCSNCIKMPSQNARVVSVGRHGPV